MRGQLQKVGSVLSGSDFPSRVNVPELSLADASGQMRGALIGAQMDVITGDAGTGTLLAEQRASGMVRGPVPGERDPGGRFGVDRDRHQDAEGPACEGGADEGRDLPRPDR
jgi:hypothetical protein